MKPPLEDFLRTPEALPSPVRRSLLLMLAALPAACVTHPLEGPQGTTVAGPGTTPPIRPPQVGQEWVYTVRDVYNRNFVGVVTEKVVAVGDTVRIARTSPTLGPLPDEIQKPWGTIVQDPHWSPAVRFTKPLPLWPTELRPGWDAQFRDSYEVWNQPGYDYWWEAVMSAVGWEEITVPAGKFRTFKYRNQIHYQSNELVYRLDSTRRETIWLAPEIGRWVVRRSEGEYLIEDRGGTMREDNWEWELQSWK